MTQTIVGVFNSFTQADLARERLLASGIASTDIESHKEDAGDYATAADPLLSDTNPMARETAPAGAEEPGMLAGIERFFANLFGAGDHPAEVPQYRDAVSRGGVLMSVDVHDDSQVAMVQQILQDAGAGSDGFRTYQRPGNMSTSLGAIGIAGTGTGTVAADGGMGSKIDNMGFSAPVGGVAGTTGMGLPPTTVGGVTSPADAATPGSIEPNPTIKPL